MATKCKIPNFSFSFSLPALPAFSLPALPSFSFAFNLACPLD